MNRPKTDRIIVRPPRRGAALIFGLMALLVATILLSTSMQMATMSHRQLKRDEIRVQANLLADAGCRRILSKMRKQPDLNDDVWNVPADQLELDHTAIVRTIVQASAASSERKTIIVTAEYPIGHSDRVQITRHFQTQ